MDCDARIPDVAEVVAALAAQGITLPPGPVRLDHYGDSPELSRDLLAQIRHGRKRAGTGLVWLHEHENVPWAEEGDIEIVLTHDHRPSLVTRITRVAVRRFGDVTPAYAAVEGEGDGSLAWWREAHWAYFSRVCATIGREPSEDMPVICAEFELLHRLPDPDAAPADGGRA